MEAGVKEEPDQDLRLAEPTTSSNEYWLLVTEEGPDQDLRSTEPEPSSSLNECWLLVVPGMEEAMVHDLSGWIRRPRCRCPKMRLT